MRIVCSYAIVIISGLMRNALCMEESQDKNRGLEDKHSMGHICLVGCDIL